MMTIIKYIETRGLRNKCIHTFGLLLIVMLLQVICSDALFSIPILTVYLILIHHSLHSTSSHLPNIHLCLSFSLLPILI